MKTKNKKKKKHITRLIKLLKGIKKKGGDIDTFGISCGTREATCKDPEWSDKDHKCGFTQRVPDGTFSIVVTGNKAIES